MNSESLTNVLTRQWRIVTGSKTVNPRNRMPERGASGSVGAPLEESGALPGNGASLRAARHLFRFGLDLENAQRRAGHCNLHFDPCSLVPRSHKSNANTIPQNVTCQSFRMPLSTQNSGRF